MVVVVPRCRWSPTAGELNHDARVHEVGTIERRNCLLGVISFFKLDEAVPARHLRHGILYDLHTSKGAKLAKGLLQVLLPCFPTQFVHVECVGVAGGEV